MENSRIVYTFNYTPTANNFDENYKNVIRIREENPDIPILLEFPRFEDLTKEQISKLEEIENVSWE